MNVVIERQEFIKERKEPEEDPNLFEELRKLRLHLARQRAIPPYLIFSDKTLHDMCKKKPTSKKEMLAVSGVGEVKFQTYGKTFMELIKTYAEG